MCDRSESERLSWLVPVIVRESVCQPHPDSKPSWLA